MAGVLVLEPEILVLDEPGAGLDARGRDAIFNIVQNLYKRKNLTVIFVSHCMKDVVKFVNRVIVLDKGQIKMDGPKKKFLIVWKSLKKWGLMFLRWCIL